jgi:hypothetical protein
MSDADAPHPLAWPDARRLEAWAGETRVNLIRLLALIGFYARHLADVYYHPATAGGRYHQHVTAVCVAWVFVVLAVHALLLRRAVHPALKYVTLVTDLTGVTLLGIAAGGPRTPLLCLYFVVIASTPLRLSLALVWVATLGAWAGYAALLAYYAWFLIGWHRYYATPELQIPRTEEASWFLALGVAGLLAGQVVRQARRLAAGYPVSVSAPESAEGR